MLHHWLTPKGELRCIELREMITKGKWKRRRFLLMAAIGLASPVVAVVLSFQCKQPVVEVQLMNAPAENSVPQSSEKTPTSEEETDLETDSASPTVPPTPQIDLP
jgi:cytoskeletal protein RodZ